MSSKQCVNTGGAGAAKIDKRTRENDSVSDPERVDDAVELASFAALETLPFVDDQAIPPRDTTEDRSVSLQCFVRRKNDMRLERATRFEHFEVLDDPARLGVALQSARVSQSVCPCTSVVSCLLTLYGTTRSRGAQRANSRSPVKARPLVPLTIPSGGRQRGSVRTVPDERIWNDDEERSGALLHAENRQEAQDLTRLAQALSRSSRSSACSAAVEAQSD